MFIRKIEDPMSSPLQESLYQDKKKVDNINSQFEKQTPLSKQLSDPKQSSVPPAQDAFPIDLLEQLFAKQKNWDDNIIWILSFSSIAWDRTAEKMRFCPDTEESPGQEAVWGTVHDRWSSDVYPQQSSGHRMRF